MHQQFCQQLFKNEKRQEQEEAILRDKKWVEETMLGNTVTKHDEQWKNNISFWRSHAGTATSSTDR